MKSIIMAAALCICSFTVSAQLNLSKEIKVQDFSNVKKVVLDCNAGFLAPRAEYKSFVEYMKRAPENSVVHALNFHIKYTSVRTADSAIHTGGINNNESLTADFMTYKLNCNSIVADNIPFTGLDYSNDNYNVSLATNLGLLTFTNIATGKAKRFSLTSLGYGIYTGSVTSTAGIKETVVVVLNRWGFSIGG